MALRVDIKISGDKETLLRLNKLGQSLTNFREAMQEAGQNLERYFSDDVFRSQGGVIDANWPALKLATKQRKAKIYSLSKPLINTGEMRDSFTSEASKNSVTVTNTAPYFKYHQSSAPRSKLPRRVMMNTSKNVRSIVADIIEIDIRNKIKKAGF